ncbi:MAG: CPBP family intramembrane metalloprotease [Clostridia bacterium]|nr:CPBP family intramembrane metalloprotease [Clostridia bacterium]
MENLKEASKQIRKISNRATLPILVYSVLYLGFTAYVPELITDILRSKGLTLSNSTDNLMRYIFIYLLILPLCILSYKLISRKEGATLKSGFRKPEKPFGWCLKWIVIAIGASTMLGAVPTLISTVLQMIFGTSVSPLDSLFSTQSLSVIAVPKTLGAVIPPLIFAPIFEELMFRGLIFKNSKPLGELFAIIVSGLFFGLWHQNLPQVCTTAFMGMFFCFIYLKTKSIFPCILAHFCNNLVVVIRDLIASRLDFSNFKLNPIETLADNWLLLLLFFFYAMALSGRIITGLVLFIIELVKRKELRFEKSSLNISNKRKLLTFFTAPVTLIVTVYLIAISVLNTIFGYFWFLK